MWRDFFDSKRMKKLDSEVLKMSLKISKVAASLFSRKGYLETTMDDIAHAAKISKGGIYYYFKSKPEVLYFILNNHMDLVLGGLEDQLGRLKTGNEKLKYFVSRHIDQFCKNTNEAKNLTHESHCLPSKYYNEILKKERKYYKMAFNILTECCNGERDKNELTVLTFLLFGMCNWNYYWYNKKGPITPIQLSDLICRTFQNVSEGRNRQTVDS